MEKQFDISQLYIVDFVKSLGQKKNIFALIYLLLNVLLVTGFVMMVEPNGWLALLYGILLYGVTATVALSPLGEWGFRITNGCKKITDPDILNRLQPLFEEVKEQAKAQSGFVVDDRICLYINDSDDINAFALGRRTVCVTRGLLQLSDEQIKGVLGHEFGHLVTHDTDLTLLITVGNFLISAIVTVIRGALVVYHVIMGIMALFMGEEGAIVLLMRALSSLITTLCINGLMWAWTKLGILLVMKSSRDAEYEADAFSCRLGYGDGLLSFFRILDRMERKESKNTSIFAALSASHPATSKRIARLESACTPLTPGIQ